MVRKYLQRFRAFAARIIAWLIFGGPMVVSAGKQRLILDPRSGRLTPLIAGGAPDGDDGDGDDDDDGGDDDSDDSDDDDGDGDDDQDGEKDADYWKRMARKHEKRNKANKARADKLAEEARTRDAENETEQEKKLKAARDEGRTEALTEAQKERRSDRLEVAVTRIAARGVKLGSDDALTKFADPEDALTFVERAIAKGDLDEDEIFTDDHKVDSDAVTDALVDLLRRKPRLADSASSDSAGDSDAGKGRRRKDPGEETVEDHLKKVKKNR